MQNVSQVSELLKLYSGYTELPWIWALPYVYKLWDYKGHFTVYNKTLSKCHDQDSQKDKTVVRSAPDIKCIISKVYRTLVNC